MTRIDTSRAPAYQVDFTAASTGKKIGMTKRRIRFRFGFANLDALADGLVGVDCRGEEHEVLCVWSVTSGKRQVILDGREVHHSVSASGAKVQGKFEFSFNFKGQHILQLVAHAGPPVAADHGGLPQRQFDLFLDGQSYFEFSKIYQLGRGGPAMTNVVPGTALAVVSPNAGAGRGPAAAPPGQGYGNYTLDDNGGAGRDAYGESTYNDDGYSSYNKGGYGGGSNAFSSARRTTMEYRENEPACVTPTASDSSIRASPPPVAPEPEPVPEEPVLVDLISDAQEPAPVPAPVPAPAPVQAPAPVAPVAPVQALPPAPIDTSFQAPQVPPAYDPSQQGYNNGASPQRFQQAPAPPVAPQPAYGSEFNPHGQPTPQSFDAYAPQADEFAPQPTQANPMNTYHFQQASHQIMSQYNEQAPQHLAIANQPHNPEGGAPGHETAIIAVAPAAKLTMDQAVNPFEEEERKAKREEEMMEPVDALSKAVANLVNVNDIASEPEKPLENTKLTMGGPPVEDNVIRDKRGRLVRSKGIAPPAASWNGQQPSLSAMKEVTQAQRSIQQTREVMKAPPPSPFHPAAVQAGALVVYGVAPPPPQQGMEQPMGFGAGAMQQQQQPQYYAPPPQQQYHQPMGVPQPGYHHPVRS